MNYPYEADLTMALLLCGHTLNFTQKVMFYFPSGSLRVVRLVRRCLRLLQTCGMFA